MSMPTITLKLDHIDLHCLQSMATRMGYASSEELASIMIMKSLGDLHCKFKGWDFLRHVYQQKEEDWTNDPDRMRKRASEDARLIDYYIPF